MLKVYIAGPLTKRGKADASPAGRELNVTEAMAVAAELVAKGFNVYVPHSSHYIDILASEPIPYETWMAIDFEWLEKCDVLYRMPGHSPGADREVEHAKQHDIPVVFLLADLETERARGASLAEASAALAALQRRKVIPIGPAAGRAETEDGIADKVRGVLAALRPSADEELFIEVRHKDGSRARRVFW